MPDRPAPELAAAVARAIAACGAPPYRRKTARRLVVLLELIAATPVGVTTVRDPLEAVERHVADALRGLVQVDAAPPGALAGVGSGGIGPRAGRRPPRAARAARRVRCAQGGLPGRGRRRDGDRRRGARRALEEVAASGGPLRDACAVVVARALAAPPVAAELCLPLAAPGGRVVLWIGASAEPTAIAAAAERVGGALVESADGLAVIAKHAPTPAGFPRRPGMAAKRPLA